MDGDSGAIGGVGGAGDIGGVGGARDIGGIGAGGGRKDKGPNTSRLEAAAKREARPDPREQNDPHQRPLRVFPDGSKLLFDWCQIHPVLLCHIICQITDICWALVLGRILKFIYNKDRDNINQHKNLDVEGFADKVKLGTNEKTHKKAGWKVSGSSMAVGSLKKAMIHIHDIGIEKMKDTKKKKSKTLTIKGSFIPVKDATPRMIVNLLETYGPVGLTLDLTGGLLRVKDGIYRVPKLEDGLKRHVVTIVAHGLTLDGEVFFDVQNTWGTDWGVEGHGRIIITGTTNDIFYLNELVGKSKKK